VAHVLVIDDEPDLVRFVRRALEGDGHRVSVAFDGAVGLGIALADPPDLLILDLLMPGVNGRAVLAAMMASHPDVRILVLSAEADVRARVEVLEAGAADFLAKPFAVRELLARVRRRLDRELVEPLPEQSLFRVGNITLDLQTRMMTVDDRTVALSPREFMLLRHLMTRADKVCTREELLSEVWGYAFDPSTNVVDVCVGRLRHKVRGNRIRTVRNVGYQLREG
jgi:DNA-binding response OmpR family regulator